jgi:hypothetical protein
MAAIPARADALVLLAFDGTDCAIGLAEATCAMTMSTAPAARR